MIKYISILRGINVGGRRKILMTDLKALYASLGFSNITTYIQSGNVIFSAEKEESIASLSQKIAYAITKKYDFDVPVIIRTIQAIERVIESNPFLDKEPIEKLCVTFLSDTPLKEDIEKLKEKDYTPDKYQVIGKDVFIYCDSGKYHKTKLTNQLFEKKLGLRATTRNWKTVNKLMELARNS